MYAGSAPSKSTPKWRGVSRQSERQMLSSVSAVAVSSASLSGAPRTSSPASAEANTSPVP